MHQLSLGVVLAFYQVKTTIYLTKIVQLLTYYVSLGNSMYAPLDKVLEELKQPNAMHPAFNKNSVMNSHRVEAPLVMS